MVNAWLSEDKSREWRFYPDGTACLKAVDGYCDGPTGLFAIPDSWRITSEGEFRFIDLLHKRVCAIRNATASRIEPVCRTYTLPSPALGLELGFWGMDEVPARYAAIIDSLASLDFRTPGEVVTPIASGATRFHLYLSPLRPGSARQRAR